MIAIRSTSGNSRALGTLTLFGLALLVAPGAARAEDAEAARMRQFHDQYERAARAYNAKDYAAAVPALRAAYAIQPLPQLLFNIAQAYRRLDDFAAARVYFELYRSLDLNMRPDVVADVDRYIAEVKSAEEAEKHPQIIERTKLLYVQSEKPLPRFLRPAGIATSVTGLALLAGGATFLGLNGRCVNPPIAPALECDQVYTTQTPGIVLTAVGGGALLIGSIWLGLSFKKPAKPAVRETMPPSIPDEDQLPTMRQILVPIQRPDREPPPSGWNEDGTRRLS